MEQVESMICNKYGIITRENNGEFRSLYDVLKDVSKIYNTLDDDNKKIIRELIFGSHCSKETFESYIQ